MHCSRKYLYYLQADKMSSKDVTHGEIFLLRVNHTWHVSIEGLVNTVTHKEADII